MSRKLTDEVSVSEMLEMREKDHLGNMEIAERLGVAYTTVVKYIGKQPKDSYPYTPIKKRGWTLKADASPVATPGMPKVDYPFVTRLFEFEGLLAKYSYDLTSKSLKAEAPEILFTISRQDLRQLSAELQSVVQLLDKVDAGF